VEAVLESCKELALTRVFLGGSTQLRDSSCLGADSASWVAVRVVAAQPAGADTVLRTDLWSREAAPAVRLFFWRRVVLHPHARKVVFDAKAFLGCVLSAYEEGEVEVGEARLIDPLVGCWLLQPDRPAASFRGCLDTLGLVRSTSLGPLGSRLAVAGDLGLLSALGQRLFRRLEGLNLWSLFYELEMRVLPELAGMERRGVCLDRGRLEHLGRCLARQLEAIEGQAHSAAGRQFNLCSPAQVLCRGAQCSLSTAQFGA
jgi:hypothetical protein